MMNANFPKSAKIPNVPPNAVRSQAIIDSIRDQSMAAIDDYQSKRSNRADRLASAAVRAKQEAEARFQASHDAVKHIPLGQPILVGHHSEKGHRRDLERCHNHMDKGCEALKKAKDLAYRAKAAEENDAIFADDPEALKKLREKLAELKHDQAHRVAVNKAHAAYLKKPASLDKAELSDQWKERIRNYVPAYSWEKHPFPPYSISNAGANIRRVEQRIEELSKARMTEGAPDRVIGDVCIVDNVAENRVQIFFLGKPDEAMRKQLKGYGFRWSPTARAWQAYRGNRTEIRLQWLFPELKA